MGTNTLEIAWQRQKDWSETANRLKNSFFAWNKVFYTLTAIAALAGTISTYFTTGTYPYVFTTLLATIAAVMSPIIAKMRLDPKHSKQWLRARSASEAYKSEIFQFRTLVGKYGEEDRSQALVEAISIIDSSVADIHAFNAQKVNILEEMVDDLSIAEYFDNRIKRQIKDYYRPNTKHHGDLSRRYQTYHLILMLFSAIIGAIATVTHLGLGPWIAVVTTITSSLLAYGAAGRHDYLALSYAATANRLEEILVTWQDSEIEEEISLEQRTALVNKCEEVISIENQSWHAKLSNPIANSPS